MNKTRFDKYLPPAFISLVFLAAYGVLYAYSLPLLADADTPWHLFIGQKILELRTLPAQDIWSFTAGDSHWYITTWLWDVTLALVHALGGFKLLFSFVMVICAAMVALLLHALIRRGDAHIDTIILTMVMVGLTLIDFANARPHVISFVYIVCFQHILHISRRPAQQRLLAWLPVIMLLWVNSHSSYVVGFTLLAAYLGESIVRSEKARTGQLLLIGSFCYMSLYLNPYGNQVYQALINVIATPLYQYASEWQPLTWQSHAGTTGWIALFAIAALLGKGKSSPAEGIIAFFWFFALLRHQQNAAIFVLVSAPLMTILLQGLITRYAHLRIDRADMRKVVEQAISRHHAFGIALFVVAFSYIGMDQWRANRDYEEVQQNNPNQGIAFFQERCAGKHFLNDYRYGGLILFKTGGACQVFIDGRGSSVYPLPVIESYLSFMNLEEDWWKAVSPYKIDGLFLDRESNFAKEYRQGHYRDHWEQVYEDSVFSMYMRKK